jgi:peptidoglycan/LPS O-acetylase OafA/YrhL
MLVSPKNRWTVLDVVRSLAVVLVLCRLYHFLVDDQSLLGSFIVWIQARGWIGVDLFFVLSGFLVGHLLFREHQQTGRIRGFRFLVRRAFKIYPGFYFLILLSAIGVLPTERPISSQATFSEIFFFQSYCPGIWRHTWSLAIEEHFYLALTILLIVLTRFKQALLIRFWPVFVAGICIICLTARTFTALTGPFEYERNLSLRISELTRFSSGAFSPISSPAAPAS